MPSPCRASGAREPVGAAACVLEDEARIATLAERLAGRAGPAIGPEQAADAVRQAELSGGFRLSEKQSELAQGILTSGHALDLVIGVASVGVTRPSTWVPTTKLTTATASTFDAFCTLVLLLSKGPPSSQTAEYVPTPRRVRQLTKQHRSP
jgi:hypothetical protein